MAVLQTAAFLFRHGGLFANQLYGMFLDDAGSSAPHIDPNSALLAIGSIPAFS